MSDCRIATWDEVWIDGRRVASRLSHGQAVEDALGLVATDTRDDQLVAAAERELSRLRDAMPRDARVRLVARAGTDGISGTMTIGRGGVSIVTTAEHAATDDRLLIACSGGRSFGRAVGGVNGESSTSLLMTSNDVIPLKEAGQLVQRASGFAPERSRPGRLGMTERPILWKNGSAAILLHEAFGHPAEHAQASIEWPAWLTIDLGLRSRRATFRDVPLLRMTHVAVSHDDAPFDVPDDVIEVELVAGGAYDPLTETVTLQIAVPRFELRATRRQVAQSLAGAYGDPIRYPGVVCSREGQELVVPSFAPVMITR